MDKMSNTIALLPILSSQKTIYNFKDLSGQVNAFVDAICKKILSMEGEYDKEDVKKCVAEQIVSFYGDKNKKSDVRRPEQAKSAYIYFCTEKRQEVKDQFPDLDSKEITVKLAQLWRDCTDEQKTPFVEQHLKEKQALHSAKEYSDEETDTKKAVTKKHGKKSKSKDELTLNKKQHFNTVLGFDEPTAVKYLARKNVKQLQEFCSASQLISLTMKKPELCTLALALMKQTNIKSFEPK